MEAQAPYASPFDSFKADLRIEIANLEQQRQQALETYQQATGALALAVTMLQRLEGQTVTMQQFAEMIGGEGAQATVSPFT